MTTPFVIPQGEQTVTVELTVKQAMALSGYRFNGNPQLEAEARRKIMKSLDKTLLPNSREVRYENLKI